MKLIFNVLTQGTAFVMGLDTIPHACHDCHKILGSRKYFIEVTIR